MSSIYLVIIIAFVILISILSFKIGRRAHERRINRYLLLIIFIVLCIIGYIFYKEILHKQFNFNFNFNKQKSEIVISIFSDDDCTYCDDLINFLNKSDYNIIIYEYNIADADNKKLYYDVAHSLNYKDDEIGLPFTIINDKVIIGFNKEKQKEIEDIIKDEQNFKRSYDYVKNYNDSNNSEKNSSEKLKKLLIKKGYKQKNDNIYYLDYSGKDTMYSQIDLDKHIYSDYSSDYGIDMLTEYYYKKKEVKFSYKYSNYSSNITWDLNTDKWDCESNLDNWCEENAREYVDDNMYNAIQDFEELLSKENINVDDI